LHAVAFSLITLLDVVRMRFPSLASHHIYWSAWQRLLDLASLADFHVSLAETSRQLWKDHMRECATLDLGSIANPYNVDRVIGQSKCSNLAT
jgi:hypothetical protein